MRFGVALVLAALPALGQSSYYKHNFSVSTGAALPRGELRPLFTESFGLGVGYGYRFHPYFQADLGFETVFGAARINDYLPTNFGNLRIRDYQFFLPFGGRVIVPLKRERIHLYAGGGGAYLRYSERLRQPFADSGYRFDCDVCSSRDGIGYYATLGGNVTLDEAQHFRLGAGSRVYRGHTNGDPFGDVPARRTTDSWVNVFVTFGLSF